MRLQRPPSPTVERWAARVGALAEKVVAVSQKTSDFTLMGGGTRWG